METVDGLRYKRTLYVGLGGAGAKTLTVLKKKILQANGQKLPKQIKFLLIDTNATELSNYNNFDASEKICIAVREPYERYMSDNGKHTHEYIPSRNSASLMALERGAGQVRSNGHFAVIENQYSNKLMRIFKERGDELMDIDIDRAKLEKDPKIEVRVIFSLAGGTGSGTFLPISILLRAALKHSELIGYALAPSHYERVIENSAKKTVMANGYAALAELDYMMHFGRDVINQENIPFNFGPDIKTQQIIQFDRPFDEVYYIDKRTNMPLSDTVEYTYNELKRTFENTADIIHIASTNIISGHTGTVDNVRQKIREGQFDVEDKFGWVSGVGMAEIYLNPQEKDSKEICSGALQAIKERLAAFKDTDEAVKLSGKIVDSDFDETGHPDSDKNCVQDKFLTEDEIDSYCQGVRDANTPGVGVIDIPLMKAMEQFNKTKEDVIKSQVNSFKNRLLKFIPDFIDGNLVNDKNDRDKEYVTTSLRFLIAVLKGAKSRLDQGVSRLRNEKNEHFQKKEKAEKEYDGEAKVLQDEQNHKPQKTGLLSFLKKKKTVVDHVDIKDQTAKVCKKQAEYAKWCIWEKRAEAAIDVLNACIVETEDKIRLIDGYISTLSTALNEGTSKLEEKKNASENVKEPSNRIEVKMAVVNDGYHLSYDQISTVYDFSQKETTNHKDIFPRICEMLSDATGTLSEFLVKSINQIDSKIGDYITKGRQERSYCQKAIENLIDLSAPTMQIDGHGYGSKIKADQFYYIMTSDDEINFDSKDLKEIKKRIDKEDSVFNSLQNKTVAGMLQYLLEQNSLDIHVQRVNVRGWTNKAILYRVKSAVPPYFIEGVAKTSLGGVTMEDCYEELKHTRLQYTPFSHETLRQKLEDGKSVLKPHNSLAEDIAMEHWVNFLWLAKQDENIDKNEFIHFKPEFNPSFVNCDKQQGAVGIYSIESDGLGCCLTGELSDQKKILILGKTRIEAFHKFSRYCQDILSEHKGYLDRMNHPESCKLASEMMELTGEQYLTVVLPEWKTMFFDEEDKKLLRQEMEYIDRRRKKFHGDMDKANQNRDIANDHKGNGHGDDDKK